MNRADLATLRRDYAGQPLTRAAVDADPFVQFGGWLDEALSAEITDANAMTISTVDADCHPSSRVVLLKGFDHAGFVFFTNYESKKGSDLATNPYISLSFFWPQLHRQVSISGRVEKTSREDSEKYFKSRPVDSQIAAWASNQSEVVKSREDLEQQFAELSARYGEQVPRPPHWGGYRVKPAMIEFWQGRDNRLHDRLRYRLQDNGSWLIERLAP